MKRFISCDWGTSAFRLRLVEAGSKKIIVELITRQGIADTNRLLSFAGPEADRFSFFRNVLLTSVRQLERECGSPLKGSDIILSGMATSGIGMLELPYISVPFAMDAAAFTPHVIMPAKDFNYRLLFITGARTKWDVMRGEETILLGCSADAGDNEQLFIMPGTHSKHVVVRNQHVTDFHTYMTGEVFELLTVKSILSASVLKDANDHPDAFDRGVADSLHSNILNSIFRVRTNRLFGYLSAGQNYQYLSGLLIGSELNAVSRKHPAITIISGSVLSERYLRALQAIAPEAGISLANADEALVTGQEKIWTANSIDH